MSKPISHPMHVWMKKIVNMQKFEQILQYLWYIVNPVSEMMGNKISVFI